MAANETSFRAGNQAALKHGTRSTQLRESNRRELLSEMRQLIARGLGEAKPEDELARDFLACALADVRQADDYITRHGGPVAVKGHVLKVAHWRRAREHDARDQMDRLGLSPKARSAILGGAVQVEGLATQLARQRLAMARPVPGPQNGHAGEGVGLEVSQAKQTFVEPSGGRLGPSA